MCKKIKNSYLIDPLLRKIKICKRNSYNVLNMLNTAMANAGCTLDYDLTTYESCLPYLCKFKSAT